MGVAIWLILLGASLLHLQCLHCSVLWSEKLTVTIQSDTHKIPQPWTPDLANGLRSCDLSLEVRSVLHNIQLYGVAGTAFSMDLIRSTHGQFSG